MKHTILLWLGFHFLILSMLALDLGVFHRKPREVKLKESLTWCGIWIAIALLFGLGVNFGLGRQASLEFLTGYLVEKSLSIDNIFIFLIIFNYFKVPQRYQYKVLYWGILGALIVRATFIAIGISLLAHFHAVIYLFGGFLIWTGAKMAMETERPLEFEQNRILSALRRFIPVTHEYSGDRFFIHREKGQGRTRRVATPLFVALVMIELTDILFATDSIPAVIAISSDPFIVYTSNIFAILGLRSMYFALASLQTSFHYLKYGLSATLVFVGIKMVISDFHPIPVTTSLTVVLILLSVSVLPWLGRRKIR